MARKIKKKIFEGVFVPFEERQSFVVLISIKRSYDRVELSRSFML